MQPVQRLVWMSTRVAATGQILSGTSRPPENLMRHAVDAPIAANVVGPYS